jgi:hypothetical protein
VYFGFGVQEGRDPLAQRRRGFQRLSTGGQRDARPVAADAVGVLR